MLKVDRASAHKTPQSCHVSTMREGRSPILGYVIARAGRYGAGRELFREPFNSNTPGSLAYAVNGVVSRMRGLIPSVYIDPPLLPLIRIDRNLPAGTVLVIYSCVSDARRFRVLMAGVLPAFSLYQTTLVDRGLSLYLVKLREPFEGDTGLAGVFSMLREGLVCEWDWTDFDDCDVPSLVS